MSAFPWSEFFVLVGLGLLGVLAVIPYSLALTGDKTPQVNLPRPLLFAISLVQNLVLMAIAAGVGLLVTRPIGLEAPLIQAALAGQSPLPGLLKLLPLSVGLGVLFGLLLITLEIGLFRPRLPRVLYEREVHISTWKSFLASFYGGLGEEILLRWFLMGLFAWLLGRLWQAPGGLPTAGAFWIANLLAAVLFGLGHLPATKALTPLTPLVVTRGLLLNGLAGILFGYLFWQHGLEAAMLAHFSMDLVIHVVTPLLSRRRSAAGDGGQAVEPVH